MIRALSAAERALNVAVLAGISILPLVEIAARLAERPIAGTIPLVQHLTLWIACLGAALAASSGRLLALSTASLLPAKARPVVHALTSGLGAGISVALLVASVRLTQIEREAGDLIAWGIPRWTAIAILPFVFALIATRLVWRTGQGWRPRLLALAAVAVPAFFAFLDAPVPGLVTAGVAGVLVAVALGMPIFAALGAAAMLLLWNDGVPAASVPSEIYRLTASPMLPAIPMFTLAGYIFSEGGSSRRLMRLFSSLVGWLPGGLAIVTTLVLAFFTPFTGASGVTILSMGGLLLPMLMKARYPEDTSIGLVTVSGSIGLLFPPSLPVILYGISAQTPIDRLFVAGLLPGGLLVAAVAGWGAWRGWRSGAERSPLVMREVAAALWEAKWELMLPVVVLTGIFGGFATLVEAAALTVLYGVIVECFIHRDLGVRADLPRLALESAAIVGGFLIVLGVAMAFTNFLIQARVPMLLLAWVKAHVQSPLWFLLALNVFLILVGAAMDIFSAILVIVPLITPLGLAYGIDPVHLGIVFLANMELGYLTPPMGENLFLASYRFGIPLTRAFRVTWPYWMMLLAVVLAITYLPLMGGRP